MGAKVKAKKTPCKHPGDRQFGWNVDGVDPETFEPVQAFCLACCECGMVLLDGHVRRHGRWMRTFTPKPGEPIPMPIAVEAKLQEVEPTFKHVAETVAPLFDAMTPAQLLEQMIMVYRQGLPDPAIQAAIEARGWTALELALRCLVTWMERVHPAAKKETEGNQGEKKQARSRKRTVAAHT